MNFEHFEADLVALCQKHGVRQMVVLFRCGCALHNSYLASDAEDGACAKEMATICVEAVLEQKDRIAAAIRKARRK